jgi:CRISPR-associated protein Csm2
MANFHRQTETPADPFKGKEQDLKKWIEKGIDSDAIFIAEQFGKYLVKTGFTTSQIRNVFGEIRRIQSSGILECKTDFLLLKPKLAYAAARAGNRGNDSGAKSFNSVLSLAIDYTNTKEDNGLESRFKNFCDLTEAVLAYHKAAGGKD